MKAMLREKCIISSALRKQEKHKIFSVNIPFKQSVKEQDIKEIRNKEII